MVARASLVTGILLAGTAFAGIAVYGGGAVQYVTFDRVVADVSSVREGEDVRLRFRFRNRGLASATIMRVEPGCGMDASLLRGRMVAAGEDGEIEGRIRTAGHEGAFVRSVTVRLKDPLERTIVLTVNGTVNREFVVDTAILDFGGVVGDTRLSRQIKIRLNNTAHRVLNAHSTDENFEAFLQPDQNAEVATVIVSTRAPASSGLKFGTIRVATSSPHMPQLIVPVRAVVANRS